MRKFRKTLLRKKRKNESLLKYIMAMLHLWMGLISSLVIMTVIISGCLYAFKNQISDWVNRDKVFVSTPLVSAKNPDAIAADLKKQGKELTALMVPESASRSYVISYRKSGLEYSSFYNPYSGSELGMANVSMDHFFEMVLDLHRNLMMGKAGRQINGAAVLMFCLLLLSGFVLWIPKKWKHLKQSLTIKGGAKFHRLIYDLHNALGFYTMVMLLFMAVTGLYITYPWVKNLMIVSLGGESISQISTASEEDNNAFGNLMEDMLARQKEKKNGSDVVSLSEIFRKANQALPYHGTTTVEFPNKENPRFTVTKINTQNFLGAMLPDEITFDRQGNLKSKDLFSDKTLDKQFTSLSKPLHTGEILGVRSIVFYFFICLIGFSLPVTGFLIWWHKFSKVR